MNPTATPTAGSPDPTVVALAQAIRQQETGGATNAYTATGKSGEIGAYQFEPSTWNSVAPKYGVSTPLAQATPQEQNAVAYNYIVDLKNQGYNPMQVASIWNSGNPDPNHAGSGTNSSGASYNTPAYAQAVYQNYLNYKNNPSAAPTNTTPTTPTLPTYGAAFPSTTTAGGNFANDLESLSHTPLDIGNLLGDVGSGLAGGLQAIGNFPSSIANFAGGLASSIEHPIQTATGLANTAGGAFQEATGSNSATNNPTAQTNAFDNLKTYLAQRYGSLEGLTNTAKNDPFGFGTDIATALEGGAGLTDFATKQATGEAIGASDALKGLGTDVAGAITKPVADTASGVVGTVANTLGTPNTEALAASERTGVNLPASSYTTNPVIAQLDAIAQKGLGGQQSQARVDQAISDMNAIAQKTVDETGGVADLTEAGTNVSKALNDFTTAYKKANTATYGAISNEIGDVAAQTQRPAQILQQIIKEKEAIGDTEGLGFFKQKLQVLTGGKAEETSAELAGGEAESSVKKGNYTPPTFDTLKKMKTNIGQKIANSFGDSFATQQKTYLKQLYGALQGAEEDTIKATGRTDLLQTYRAAKTAYQDGRAIITSAYGKTIARLAANGQYDKIIPALIKPSMSVNDIPKVLAIAGEQGTKDIQSYVTSSILDKARNAEGDFTPKGIAREMGKYSDGKLEAILPAKQIQDLKDLGTLTSALGKGLKVGAGSQTAFLERAMLEGGALGGAALALVTGNPVLALKAMSAVIGTEGASLFLASKTGQNLLTWGARYGSELKPVAEAAGIGKEAEASAEGNTTTPKAPITMQPEAAGVRNTPEFKNFTRDTSLTGKDESVQEDAIAHYLTNKDALTQQYLQDNGNVVNTDEARKLFADQGYNGTNSAAVHEASSAVANDALKHLIENSPKGEGYVLSGGSGATKSTSARGVLKAQLDKAPFVLDGNLSNLASAQRKIKMAEDAGHTVTNAYIYREPVEAWNNGVISRMLTSPTDKGRVVPLKEFLANTPGALSVTKKLIEDGLPTVGLKAITDKSPIPMTIKDIQKVAIDPQLESVLVGDTEKLARDGIITKAQYEALLNGVEHTPYKELHVPGKKASPAKVAAMSVAPASDLQNSQNGV